MVFVFWIAFLFIIYTFLMYPLIIVLLSRIKRRGSIVEPEDSELPTVAMIIIVHNEKERATKKLINCRELDYPKDLLTICFVSDGSTDGTDEVLQNQRDIFFIRDATNRGKPHQINKAVSQTQSEIIVFSDVRQMYKSDAIRKLVRNYEDPKIGAVSGELTFMSLEEHTERSIGLYWQYEKILRKAESYVDSTLGVTGAIYAIRREHFSPIPDDTILDDIEIPLQSFKQGYRIIFEPEAVAYDTASSEIGREFQRKVRTLAGNFQLFSRNPWLLNPIKNRIFLQAVSHKLFRLFIPYAMAFILVTSITCKNLLLNLFFWLQIFVYGLGLAAFAFPKMKRNKIINFVVVFLSLNAATLVALYKFARSGTDVRWRR